MENSNSDVEHHEDISSDSSFSKSFQNFAQTIHNKVWGDSKWAQTFHDKVWGHANKEDDEAQFTSIKN
ncbi:unnamed protein product [Adineta ricciae]|uniref:Uncharacterized protein n=1 Tax=Adineta ricciae TaxID=249248 RepID=A0A815UAE6_ADIRI|nr:unnamed protein product [Adineta ricciae]CAF1511318.1 unnamed protein product [Adineta ricciae]